MHSDLRVNMFIVGTKGRSFHHVWSPEILIFLGMTPTATGDIMGDHGTQKLVVGDDTSNYTGHGFHCYVKVPEGRFHMIPHHSNSSRKIVTLNMDFPEISLQNMALYVRYLHLLDPFWFPLKKGGPSPMLHCSASTSLPQSMRCPWLPMVLHLPCLTPPAFFTRKKRGVPSHSLRFHVPMIDFQAVNLVEYSWVNHLDDWLGWILKPNKIAILEPKNKAKIVINWF